MERSGEDFGTHYLGMEDKELLRLAQQYDSLTEDAQSALRTEFARRGLEPPLLEGEDEVESRKLVTVRRYRDLSEAIVARSLLESAGIVVYLYDENLVRLDWQVSNFIGGIRLQVEEADEQAARELLAMPVPESIPFAEWGQFEQPRCPHCGSAEITFEGASRAAALAGLYIAGLPLSPGRETWSCSTCGARWEDTVV